MVVVSVVADSGEESSVQVSKHDLVAEVKSRLVLDCFPSLRGQLLSLTYHGRELEDEKSVGDYGLRQGAKLMVAASPRQPYSYVDYTRLADSLAREGFKRDPASFYQPGDEWQGVWSKGDEYKSYPPVDVHNPYSTIPPSTSRELAFRSKNTKENSGGEIPSRIRQKWEERRAGRVGQEERERVFRQARQKQKGKMDGFTDDDTSSLAEDESGRRFHSVYTCFVSGYRFELLHKAEGKWMGDATYTDSKLQHPTGAAHVCSSKIGFLKSKTSWFEQQLITNDHGVSTKQTFSYLPRGDGLLTVETDDPLLRNCNVTMQEIGLNVVLITATSSSGEPVLTETVTYSDDFHSRVRSGQRFSSDGRFLASYVCKERKYVDEDTGALQTI